MRLASPAARATRGCIGASEKGISSKAQGARGEVDSERGPRTRRARTTREGGSHGKGDRVRSSPWTGVALWRRARRDTNITFHVTNRDDGG